MVWVDQRLGKGTAFNDFIAKVHRISLRFHSDEDDPPISIGKRIDIFGKFLLLVFVLQLIRGCLTFKVLVLHSTDEFVKMTVFQDSLDLVWLSILSHP